MARAVFQSDLKITQRISEKFSICPTQFEMISKTLGKRFGIPGTFGFENGRHDADGIVSVCQDGCLIQESADNIDINTETVDGKDTFQG
jgi:hypothetical protein